MRKFHQKRKWVFTFKKNLRYNNSMSKIKGAILAKLSGRIKPEEIKGDGDEAVTKRVSDETGIPLNPISAEDVNTARAIEKAKAASTPSPEGRVA